MRNNHKLRKKDIKNDMYVMLILQMFLLLNQILHNIIFFSWICVKQRIVDYFIKDKNLKFPIRTVCVSFTDLWHNHCKKKLFSKQCGVKYLLFD